MIRIMVLAVVAALLLMATPLLAQPKGTLASGAKVEVATDASSFSSFNFDHDGKKTVVVKIVGPDDTKEISVDPNQKVGFSRPYHGKTVTLINTGDVDLRYEVN